MSTHFQLGFQDASSFVMREMDDFHNYIMIFIMFMMVLILYSLVLVFSSRLSFRNFIEKQAVEFSWTVFPSFILIILAMPSISLLYFMDESSSSDITVKTVGHQWYWTYEIWDSNLIELDSYMMKLEDFTQVGLPRLLEVDNRLVMPINKKMRFITTSTDVIHAWCIPALGLKMDAVPGRLNQIFLNIDRPGIFYGQCSEICGANHSFMPIVLEATNQFSFHNWCQIVAAE